jgi:hypothetical protein
MLMNPERMIVFHPHTLDDTQRVLHASNANECMRVRRDRNQFIETVDHTRNRSFDACVFVLC